MELNVLFYSLGAAEQYPRHRIVSESFASVLRCAKVGKFIPMLFNLAKRKNEQELHKTESADRYMSVALVGNMS